MSSFEVSSLEGGHELHVWTNTQAIPLQQRKELNVILCRAFGPRCKFTDAPEANCVSEDSMVLALWSDNHLSKENRMAVLASGHTCSKRFVACVAMSITAIDDKWDVFFEMGASPYGGRGNATELSKACMAYATRKWNVRHFCLNVDSNQKNLSQNIAAYGRRGFLPLEFPTDNFRFEGWREVRLTCVT